MSKLNKSLKIPEWFKRENQSFVVIGTRNKKYTLVLNTDDKDKEVSKTQELVYKIYIGRTVKDEHDGTVKDEHDGTLYIYWNDPKGAQFRDFGEKNKIESEDAIQIVKEIGRKFKLPLNGIRIVFYRRKRGFNSQITEQDVCTVHSLYR